jgi:hypothetical protein
MSPPWRDPTPGAHRSGPDNKFARPSHAPVDRR